MAVSANIVKQLRERTGAGMMDCKKALVKADGDLEKAVEEMRKAGQAKADKKESRTAAEGLVIAKQSDDNHQAIILEVNCETDFVARDGKFKEFANQLADEALRHNLTDPDKLSETVLPSGETIEQRRKDLINQIGEKISIRRISIISEGDHISCYSHGGQIGVIVAIKGGDKALAKDLAMHIAASQPQSVSPDNVPQTVIDKEKEIFKAQARESGKPENIIEKMVSGKIDKFINEQSLEGQAFVKDPSIKVGNLLKDKNASVITFARYSVGEGIEKEQVDFGTEVMSQAKGE